MADITKQPEKKAGAFSEIGENINPEMGEAIPSEHETEKEEPAFIEKEEHKTAEKVEKEEPAVTVVSAPMTPPPPKSGELVKIEKILEEDLEDFYFSMPPEQQKIFKEKGEETASAIEKMIRAGKAVGRKILKLIRTWLKLIPGVNKFFLEQEAKIKTDEIVKIAEERKKASLE